MRILGNNIHEAPPTDKEIKETLLNSQKKLTNMILDYKKRKQSERDHHVKDFHIMDRYIQVLTFLHKTNRFEKFFDPMRLKMMLIKPIKMESGAQDQAGGEQITTEASYPN